jgi:pimeloyl-ACP methyl ester carboxylesterase
MASPSGDVHNGRAGFEPTLPRIPMNLRPALPGHQVALQGTAGGICVYESGGGAPLLLIHSINAAASAAEVMPLYTAFGARRRVIALDLPGFGLSERSDRVYSPRLMTDAIMQVVGDIRRRHGNAPIDALALSLSCEFLARAALENPGSFRSLAWVSPTGFGGRRRRDGPAGSTLGMPWLYRALRGPSSAGRSGWGRALFRGLTRPNVIRYFLRRTWGSRDIDEGLWRYDIEAARAPGAEFAPLYFLSANLFSADILTVYEQLDLPIWLSHGVRGDFTDYRREGLIAARPHCRVTVYPTGALPHFELPERFCADYDDFLRQLPAQPAAPATALDRVDA